MIITVLAKIPYLDDCYSTPGLLLRRFVDVVEHINSLEPGMLHLSETELQAKTGVQAFLT